jgi:hypothetical protein
MYYTIYSVIKIFIASKLIIGDAPNHPYLALNLPAMYLFLLIELYPFSGYYVLMVLFFFVARYLLDP